MNVALDTMTLIWGIRREGNPKQTDLAEMQYRSAILIETHTDDGSTILIPCISVSELLIGIDTDRHAEFIASFKDNVVCPPFDIRASELAAKLFKLHRKLSAAERLSRVVLKADAMIIASAVVAGAAVFYSHDSKCRTLAKSAGLEARDLPHRHIDPFRNLELKREFGIPTDE